MTGLPLPLGGNAIRRALGPELSSAVTGALRDSIQYALDTGRSLVLRHAVRPRFGLANADRFVGMYVNERTLDYVRKDVKAWCVCLIWGTRPDYRPEARVIGLGEGSSF